MTICSIEQIYHIDMTESFFLTKYYLHSKVHYLQILTGVAILHLARVLQQCFQVRYVGPSLVEAVLVEKRQLRVLHTYHLLPLSILLLRPLLLLEKHHFFFRSFSNVLDQSCLLMQPLILAFFLLTLKFRIAQIDVIN